MPQGCVYISPSQPNELLSKRPTQEQNNKIEDKDEDQEATEATHTLHDLLGNIVNLNDNNIVKELAKYTQIINHNIMPCWYYDKKELRSTASIRDGITFETERRYRKEGARFIMSCGTQLGLGHNTMATGIVYFHRFYMFHSFRCFPRYVTAACCLFLAGKVEETPKKCRDVIKTARAILNDNYFYSFGDDPKEEVMTLERVLLQTIKFDLQVEHPYSFLLKYAKCFKGDQTKLQKMVQMAWNFVNDSLSTTVCLQWEPEIIAVALIHLASKLSKFTVTDWTGRLPKHLRWWDMFVDDVTMEILEDICHQVLDLYTNNQKGETDSANSPPQKPPSRADSPTPMLRQTHAEREREQQAAEYAYQQQQQQQTQQQQLLLQQQQQLQKAQHSSSYVGHYENTSRDKRSRNREPSSSSVSKIKPPNDIQAIRSLATPVHHATTSSAAALSGAMSSSSSSYYGNEMYPPAPPLPSGSGSSNMHSAMPPLPTHMSYLDAPPPPPPPPPQSPAPVLPRSIPLPPLPPLPPPANLWPGNAAPPHYAHMPPMGNMPPPSAMPPPSMSRINAPPPPPPPGAPNGSDVYYHYHHHQQQQHHHHHYQQQHHQQQQQPHSSSGHHHYRNPRYHY